MKIAGYSYSFDTMLGSGELTTAAIIHFLDEMDIEAVEITGGYFQDGELPEIRKALADTKMTVCCYDLVCDVVNDDRSQREASIDEFLAELGRAAQLEARAALVIPGEPREGIPHSPARDWFAEALKEGAPEASRLGLTLLIANVGWQPVVYGTSQQMNEMCEAVGQSLKVTYDVGNFLLCGEDSLQALDRVASRISHVHFKDWTIVPEGEPLEPRDFPGSDGRVYRSVGVGQGIVDLRGAVRRLRHLGYEGFVSVEYEGMLDARECNRQSLEHVRRLLEESD